MTCEHLKKLFQLCEQNELKISSSDVIRISCSQCEEIEVCPVMLTDEYDAREADDETDAGQPAENARQ